MGCLKIVVQILLVINVCLAIFRLSAFGNDMDRFNEQEPTQNQENIEEKSYEQIAEQQLYDMGAEELIENLPPEVKDILEKQQMNYSITDIVTMTPSKFLALVKDGILDIFRKPFQVIGLLVGIIVFCGLMAAFKNTLIEKGMGDIFSMVSVLTVVTIISSPIISLIVDTANSLRDCANFILCFIPVFSGVVTASGQPITAGSYTILIFSLCQIVAQVAITIILPLMEIYFALSIISSIFPDVPLKSLTTTLRSIVCWGLGLTTTIFVSLLSIQTLVSHSSDGISIKTTKFLIGNFVPIVGGALSDALQTARGCISFIKNTVGAFGVLVASLTFIPLIIEISIWYFATNIASEISNMVDAKELSNVLKSASQTLAILMALLMCFGLIIIISITIVMMMGIG